MQLQTFYYFQVGVIVIPGNTMHMHYLGGALNNQQKHSDLQCSAKKTLGHKHIIIWI